MHIFPEDQVDENFFDLYYHPYKKQIWGFGFLLTIAVLTFLGVREMRQRRLDEQWTRHEEALALRTRSLPGQADADQVSREVEALRGIVNDYPDDPVAAWALRGIVDAHVAAADWGAAKAGLDELRTRFPDFALNTLPAGDADGARSLADQLRASIESEEEWQAATKYEHVPPSDERIAIIDTNLGSLQIGFYSELAPEHVAAFVERAKRGDYNGTQFYDVRLATDGSPQLVSGGSAASKSERDPAAHDRDEPGDVIEPEDSRFLVHHELGIVSAVDMPSGESATAFQIVTSQRGMQSFNGRITPFAAVLDREGGLETLARIGRAPTYGTNPDTAEADGMFRMRDHPYPPILIRRVAILTNEKVEDGHAWDTSRVGTDEAEPWEAELPPPPLPDEFAAPSTTPDEGAAPGDGQKPGEESSGDADNPAAGSDAGDDPGDATQDGGK